MRSRMLRSASVLLLFCALPLLWSCEHSGPFEADDDEPTLENVQETVFNTSCAVSGCHAGASPQQGLDLSPGVAGANLIGVDSRELPSFKRVDPGNPDDSYLVMKIEGDSRIVGQRMPIGRPPLSSAEITLVREWVASIAAL